MKKLRQRKIIKRFMQLALPFQLTIIGVLVIFVGSSVFASVYVLTNPGGSTLNNGLVGSWPFNGNANDTSGYGNNGTTTGVSLTTDQSGNANSAYSFAGSSGSNISFPNPVPNFISADSAPFSFGMWVNPSTLAAPTGGQRTIMGNETYLTSGFRFCTTSSNKFGFWTIQSGGTLDVVEGTTVASTGTWYYLTVTYDGTTARLYVNGTQENSGTGTIKANTNNVVLAGGVGGTSYFGGTIDQVRFYNRQLSGSEVTQLYSGGGGTTNSTLKLAAGEKQMVGQWPFSGNAYDNTPNGNNGTVTGATLTTDRMGKANSAYAFSGASQYISVADTTTLEFAGDYAVSAWMKSSSSSTQTLLGKYAGTASDQYQLSINAGVASFQSGSTTISGGSGLANGAWHLVTGVKSGSTGYLYVDGTQVGTAAVTGSTTGGTSYLGIGKYGSSGTNYFNGSLDDIRIYSRAISTQEISDLYASYNANFSVSDLQAGQAGRWRFDNNATDTTPYANDGTTTGVTLTTDRLNRANMAYSFNGTTSQITTARPSLFIPSNNAPFSISMWVKPNTLTGSTDTRALLNNEVYGVSGFRMGIDTTTAKPSLWCVEDGGTMFVDSTVALTNNTWANIVVTYNGTNAAMYINGQSAGTGSGTIISGSAGFIIGNIGGKDRFSGVMDDVRVWNRALSAAEAARLYETY